MKIFIGGTGRSGTTILGNIFDASPNILYFREPRFICDTNGIYDYINNTCSEIDLLETFHKTFLGHITEQLNVNWTGDWNDFYTTEFVDDLFKFSFSHKDRIKNARKFTYSFFTAGMRVAGKTYWVEKTPHTVKHTHLLWQMFPDMRYIHMFRDPRDIFPSARRYHWGPSSADKFIDWYKNVMDNAWRDMLKVPEENYVALDLSDLVATPEPIVQGLFQFAGVKDSNEQIAHYATQIDPAKAHQKRWEKEITRQERTLIGSHCLPIYAKWREYAENHRSWLNTPQ